jgi:hypothetical protein
LTFSSIQPFLNLLDKIEKITYTYLFILVVVVTKVPLDDAAPLPLGPLGPRTAFAVPGITNPSTSKTKPIIAKAYAHPAGTVTLAEDVCVPVPSVPAVLVSALNCCTGIKYNNAPITRKITPNMIRLVLILFPSNFSLLKNLKDV